MASNRSIRVDISADGMSAACTVLAVEGLPAPSVEDLRQALADAGVKCGIDEEALRLAEVSPPGARTIVARGEPPKPGCDGVIRLREAPGSTGAPKLLPDGRVDYRDMQLVRNVIKGQVLAEKEPPLPGRPGMSVKGAPLYPPEVKDPQFAAGRNTAVTPDGTQLVSLIDGHLVVESTGLGRNEIRVDETFVLKKSVDMSTGNIHCIGHCEIRGNVAEGFKVAANGDIRILGNVEGAEITSHAGSIRFEKGVKGQGKGRIRAARDIHAKFIENATIEAGGDVIVAEHVMHSTILTAGGVSVEGSPGVLLGGRVAFVTRLKARQVGADSNPRTAIYMGDWIVGEARKRIQELKDTLKELRAVAESMHEGILELRRLSLEDPDRHGERIATLSKSTEPYPRTLERMKEVHDEIVDLEKKVRPAETKPVMEVTGSLFPGVTFSGEGIEEAPVRRERRSLRITIAEDPDGKPAFSMRQLRG